MLSAPWLITKWNRGQLNSIYQRKYIQCIIWVSRLILRDMLINENICPNQYTLLPGANKVNVPLKFNVAPCSSHTYKKWDLFFIPNNNFLKNMFFSYFKKMKPFKSGKKKKKNYILNWFKGKFVFLHKASMIFSKWTLCKNWGSCPLQAGNTCKNVSEKLCKFYFHPSVIKIVAEILIQIFLFSQHFLFLLFY